MNSAYASGGTVTLGSPTGAASATNRERRLFDALRTGGGDRVSVATIRTLLAEAGIRESDPRVATSVRSMLERTGSAMDHDAFAESIRPGLLMFERVLTRQLVIPRFDDFSREVELIFARTAVNHGGKVADYIPQLRRVAPEQYGMALTTVDGQRLSLGDATTDFCVQSATKPIIYALALEEHGADVVHERIGCEPSGHSFNELTLDTKGRPHNPMINAGAILSSSMIRPREPMADRFEYMLDQWARSSGGNRPGFNNPTYLSERKTADRNFALGYFMRENGGFAPDTDLVETLEFYFQNCSLEVTAEMMSVVAATLANGGVCPTTGERVFQPDTVQKCLSLMYSCGMYDFSGEWAFSVGLPAKSGVSGVIMVVVPNVMGFCTWSPRLDELGNSVRGIDFAQAMVSTFNFHNYDNLVGTLSGKQDPRVQDGNIRRDLIVDMCWAASEGDVEGVRRLVVQGADLGAADYDRRTPLHLAASEGHADVVAYLLSQGVDPGPVDRWANTPLDDARRSGHTDVVTLFGHRKVAA